MPSAEREVLADEHVPPEADRARQRVRRRRRALSEKVPPHRLRGAVEGRHCVRPHDLDVLLFAGVDQAGDGGDAVPRRHVLRDALEEALAAPFEPRAVFYRNMSPWQLLRAHLLVQRHVRGPARLRGGSGVERAHAGAPARLPRRQARDAIIFIRVRAQNAHVPPSQSDHGAHVHRF